MIELSEQCQWWTHLCPASQSAAGNHKPFLSPSSRHKKDEAALATEAALAADEKGPSCAKHGQPDLQDGGI